jgi:uncharacterized protein (TIGR00304 family)
MNRFHILSLICLILGIIFFSLGFYSGDTEAGIFIIFPFISGSGVYLLLGFIFIFTAIILYSFGFMRNITSYDSDDVDPENPEKKPSMKVGGVVLIGPIPLVFGSNWKIALALMVVAIILIIVSFFSFRFI